MKLFKMMLGLILLTGCLSMAQAKVLVDDDLKGWRDEGTNPGFNGYFKLDSNTNEGSITLMADKKFGKVMSAEQGYDVEIKENTKIYIKLLNDISGGTMTVNLMTAGEPYDAHKVIASVDKKGVYSANIAEKTPWTGRHLFWVELWLGGDSNPSAKIAAVKITDGELSSDKSTVIPKKIRRVKSKKTPTAQ